MDVPLCKLHPSEYATWRAMRNRCGDPQTKDFHKYGRRGVRVCISWFEFDKFLADMGPRPSPHHALDRYPDCAGDYEPGNCRWATPKERNRPRRYRKRPKKIVALSWDPWKDNPPEL